MKLWDLKPNEQKPESRPINAETTLMVAGGKAGRGGRAQGVKRKEGYRLPVRE